MQVAIGPGEAWVSGSSAATQSGYYARVSSSTTLTIATSDPSNPRIDRVSAIVKDKAYSGTEDTFSVAVSTGTPTSGATLVNLSGVAAAPASSLTLGYVLVPAASVSISGGNISNVATPFLVSGLTGPWITMESFGPKLEEFVSVQTTRSRLETGGATVRLRGVLKVKAAEELKNGDKIATLFSSFRPPKEVLLSISSANVKVEPGGEMTLQSAATPIPAAGLVPLDGLTFNLT